MSSNTKIIPVILSGGSGSRLWPMSRTSYPKQYLSFEKNNLSFFQMTLNRIQNYENIDDPIVICNEEHRFVAGEQLREINIKPKSIILEPFGRNTCPAIAIASLKSLEIDPEAILLILPSDHLIKENKVFIDCIKNAHIYAKQEKLVTFGIIPKSPETGYGYIKSSSSLSKNKFECLQVEEFIEKPEKELAQQLIKDSKFSWNSGMFMFKAKTIINEIKKYQPNILSVCEKSFHKRINDLYFEKINKKEFEKCINISLDKAVMEKSKISVVLPLDIGWNDIGGWESYWQNSKKDKNGNVIFGDVIHKSTKNNFIRSESRLIVGLGIEDLIVVETQDVVLIARKDLSQQVKKLVAELKEKGRLEVDEHRKIFRPWGNYYLIEVGSQWKVKRIEVNPHSSLSLQLHNHRAEHWVVVEGTASIELNDKKLKLEKNESCYVPLGTKHRLSNKGNKPLIIIEVQSGVYLGEDDIIRFKDQYGRDKIE